MNVVHFGPALPAGPALGRNDVEAGRFARHLESEIGRSLLARSRVAVLFAGIHGIAELAPDAGPAAHSWIVADVARSWRRLLRPDDALFHTGTADFSLVCSQLADPMPAMNLADGLLEVTAGHVVPPFRRPGLDLTVTVAFLGG